MTEKEKCIICKTRKRKERAYFCSACINKNPIKRIVAFREHTKDKKYNVGHEIKPDPVPRKNYFSLPPK